MNSEQRIKLIPKTKEMVSLIFGKIFAAIKLQIDDKNRQGFHRLKRQILKCGFTPDFLHHLSARQISRTASIGRHDEADCLRGFHLTPGIMIEELTKP